MFASTWEDALLLVLGRAGVLKRLLPWVRPAAQGLRVAVVSERLAWFEPDSFPAYLPGRCDGLDPPPLLRGFQ